MNTRINILAALSFVLVAGQAAAVPTLKQVTPAFSHNGNAGLNVGLMVSECGPAARKNVPLLELRSSKHRAGSSPQSPVGSGAEVIPCETPPSKSSKASTVVKASTKVTKTPPVGAVNVQGAASKNVVGVPELGVQKGPLGSAGAQPVAVTPSSVNPN